MEAVMEIACVWFIVQRVVTSKVLNFDDHYYLFGHQTSSPIPRRNQRLFLLSNVYSPNTDSIQSSQQTFNLLENSWVIFTRTDFDADAELTNHQLQQPSPHTELLFEPDHILKQNYKLAAYCAAAVGKHILRSRISRALPENTHTKTAEDPHKPDAKVSSLFLSEVKFCFLFALLYIYKIIRGQDPLKQVEEIRSSLLFFNAIVCMYEWSGFDNFIDSQQQYSAPQAAGNVSSTSSECNHLREVPDFKLVPRHLSHLYDSEEADNFHVG